MTRTALFDIDGTLIDSMSVDTALYFSAIRQVIGDVTVRGLDTYEHVTDAGILVEILEDSGRCANAETILSVKAVFVEGLRAHIREFGAFPAIDGAIDFVRKACKSGDTRVAIATDSWRASALLKLESAGFDIDGIPLVTSDDSVSRVEIMRLADAAAGGDGNSVTCFGDARWDERACRHLGCNFVAVGETLNGIRSYRGLGLLAGG